MFDEEPDPDPHGECLDEITRLTNERDHALADLKAEIANHREDSAALEALRETANESSQVHIQMHNRIMELEEQVSMRDEAMTEQTKDYAEWMPPEDYTQLSRRVDDLAALVRLLVHNIRKFNIDNVPATRAMDYLKRHRFSGNILRSDEPQPKEIPDSGGHIESADCWCGPTVEEHPGGRLVIHNQTH